MLARKALLETASKQHLPALKKLANESSDEYSEDTEEAGVQNGQLDASANVNITKNVTFSVDALNLTDSLLKYYAANPTQPRAVYENGTQVYAGVHVKF